MSQESLNGQERSVTNEANAFFDEIVSNLNLLKSFSLKMDERLSEIEEKIESMVKPLDEIKKIMLD